MCVYKLLQICSEMIIIVRYDTFLDTLDVRKCFAADDNNTIIKQNNQRGETSF